MGEGLGVNELRGHGRAAQPDTRSEAQKVIDSANETMAEVEKLNPTPEMVKAWIDASGVDLEALGAAVLADAKRFPVPK